MNFGVGDDPRHLIVTDGKTETGKWVLRMSKDPGSLAFMKNFLMRQDDPRGPHIAEHGEWATCDPHVFLEAPEFLFRLLIDDECSFIEEWMEV